MKIIVFGANGGVGRNVVEQAIALGHDVTAAVRNPAGVTLDHERLRVIACDVYDHASVEHALQDQDVAVCTLGEPSRKPTTLYSRGAHNIARAMHTQNVRRIIFLSNFGIMGERSNSLTGKLMLFLLKRVIRNTLDDHRRALAEIRKLAPEWIVVRPMALTNGPLLRKYRTVTEGLPSSGTKISRADVAHFMLRQMTENTYLNQVPAIAY